MSNEKNIPFQVKNIIDSMLNNKENIYIRGNYRNRLDDIRMEITNAISKYDRELLMAESTKRKKG